MAGRGALHEYLFSIPGIIIVTKTLTSSVNELALLLFFWFIGVIIFGSIMYYIGKSRRKSNISSIYKSMSSNREYPNF